MATAVHGAANENEDLNKPASPNMKARIESMENAWEGIHSKYADLIRKASAGGEDNELDVLDEENESDSSEDVGLGESPPKTMETLQIPGAVDQPQPLRRVPGAGPAAPVVITVQPATGCVNTSDYAEPHEVLAEWEVEEGDEEDWEVQHAVVHDVAPSAVVAATSSSSDETSNSSKKRDEGGDGGSARPPRLEFDGTAAAKTDTTTNNNNNKINNNKNNSRVTADAKHRKPPTSTTRSPSPSSPSRANNNSSNNNSSNNSNNNSSNSHSRSPRGGAPIRRAHSHESRPTPSRQHSHDPTTTTTTNNNSSNKRMVTKQKSTGTTTAPPSPGASRVGNHIAFSSKAGPDGTRAHSPARQNRRVQPPRIKAKSTDGSPEKAGPGSPAAATRSHSNHHHHHAATTNTTSSRGHHGHQAYPQHHHHHPARTQTLPATTPTAATAERGLAESKDEARRVQTARGARKRMFARASPRRASMDDTTAEDGAMSARATPRTMKERLMQWRRQHVGASTVGPKRWR